MKKVIDLKEMMIILVSVVLITVCTTALATDDLIIGGDDITNITANEYENAQTIPDEENTNTNSNINTNVNTNTNSNTNSNVNTNKNTTNNVKKYNTNNSTNLPQTGIEDYNIGILLIIGVASAMFAYKKVNDYRNI